MRRALLLTLVLLGSVTASAEELPVGLQIQLLSKMTSSIPNLIPKNAGPIKILVVHPGTADNPTRGAQSLLNAITQVGKFGSHATSVTLVPFVDSARFKAAFEAARPQLVYLAPEFDAVAGIVNVCSDSTALTASSSSAHAKQGIVLAFSLVEARPRVLVNLKQANKQQIEFRNKLLTFAVIVDR